jgi:glyceraldehyde 3-phosphate dehydrogenase
MAIRIAINGFGRIGRCVARIAAHDPEVDLVAFNDLTSADQLAYLLRYDSAHGPFSASVELRDDNLVVNGDLVRVVSERDPSKLPWKDLGVDYVLECTGFFRKREDAAKHLEAGAQFVLISAPGKGVDMTFVKGVNHESFRPEMQIIDVASCTTNCLAPVAKVLHESFGIEHAMITTIHSYTNDQALLDRPHPSDFRRARAAAVNMVPTSTGAAVAVTRALPELEGRLDGMAVRVPTPNVSLVDLVARTERPVSVESINGALRAAAAAELKGILGVTDEPLVSSDLMGNPCSSIADLGSTMVMGDRMCKVISWYDNEWGYSNRMLDALKFVDQKRQQS